MNPLLRAGVLDKLFTLLEQYGAVYAEQLPSGNYMVNLAKLKENRHAIRSALQGRTERSLWKRISAWLGMS